VLSECFRFVHVRSYDYIFTSPLSCEHDTHSDDVFLNASTLSEPVGPVQLKCVVDGPRDVTLTEAQHQQRCANSTILVSCN